MYGGMQTVARLRASNFTESTFGHVTNTGQLHTPNPHSEDRSHNDSERITSIALHIEAGIDVFEGRR